MGTVLGRAGARAMIFGTAFLSVLWLYYRGGGGGCLYYRWGVYIIGGSIL